MGVLSEEWRMGKRESVRLSSTLMASKMNALNLYRIKIFFSYRKGPQGWWSKFSSWIGRFKSTYWWNLYFTVGGWNFSQTPLEKFCCKKQQKPFWKISRQLKVLWEIQRGIRWRCQDFQQKKFTGSAWECEILFYGKLQQIHKFLYIWP